MAKAFINSGGFVPGRTIRGILAALAVSVAAGVGAMVPPNAHPFETVQVTAHGQDPGGEFCADFRLTPDQARAFLRRAVPVTLMQQHDDFDVLPCWVRGTARDARGPWQWEIRAGGTAQLESPTGEFEWLGCPSCDDLLGGRKR